MNFPNDKELEEALKGINNVEATLVIDYDEASCLDVFKYKLCQEFIKVLKKENIDQVELSKRLGVNQDVVNSIIHHKIEHFSVDELINLYSPLGRLDISLKAL